MNFNGPNLVKSVNKIKELRDIILTNIVYLGQTPCLPDKSYKRVNHQRVEVFLESLIDCDNVSESSTDSFGNPHVIIKGKSSDSQPIVLVAHMDTSAGNEKEAHYTVTEDSIIGEGLMDNSLGVGVMMSLPHILKHLGIRLNSDLILIGLVESLGNTDLRSIRSIFSEWVRPIAGAICIESGELGRLSYFSTSSYRSEIVVKVPGNLVMQQQINLNAIVILNEIMNRILEIRMPQKPRVEIVFSYIYAGYKYGEDAKDAVFGFEVKSESEEMTKEIYKMIEGITQVVSHKNSAEIELNLISHVRAANMPYQHTLVQNAIKVMENLNITPVFGSSESELSVMLSNDVPAITLGLTHGKNYHQVNAEAKIEPIFTGIAQLIGVITAIDKGV